MTLTAGLGRSRGVQFGGGDGHLVRELLQRLNDGEEQGRSHRLVSSFHKHYDGQGT